MRALPIQSYFGSLSEELMIHHIFKEINQQKPAWRRFNSLGGSIHRICGWVVV
jgi:hypothetical protein